MFIAFSTSTEEAEVPLKTSNMASFAPGATPSAIAETLVPCSVSVDAPGYTSSLNTTRQVPAGV
ncbi:MAG TPA: hypothetical protein VGF36_03605, partial [Rhodopila sp.]